MKNTKPMLESASVGGEGGGGDGGGGGGGGGGGKKMTYEAFKASISDGGDGKPNSYRLLGSGGFGTVFRFVDEKGRAYAVKSFADDDEALFEMRVIKDMMKISTKRFTLFEDVAEESGNAKPTCGLINVMPKTAWNAKGKCKWCKAAIANKYVVDKYKDWIRTRYEQPGYHFHIIMPAFHGDGMQLFGRIERKHAQTAIKRQCRVLGVLLGYINTLTLNTNWVAYDMKLQNVLYKLENGDASPKPYWLDDVINGMFVRVALSDYGGFCVVGGGDYPPKPTYVNRTPEWFELSCSKWFNVFSPVVLMLQILKLQYWTDHDGAEQADAAIQHLRSLLPAEETKTSASARVALINIVVQYWSELNKAFASDKSSAAAVRFMTGHPAYRLMRERLMSLAYN